MHPSYTAAHEGAAFIASPGSSRIWMRDRDRASLLHRLSTNDIERLRPGQGLRAVITTPIGRIIDLLSVYCLDDALLLVGSPGQGPPVYGHLRKNIFFNDTVKLEPAGSTLGQLMLYGPQAGAALGALGLPGADLPPHGIVATHWRDAPLYVAAAMPIGGAGFALFPAAEQADALSQALLEVGALALDDPTYDTLRVEQGYPAFGRELSLDYIPLEAGLWDAISFHKGCYVGQEIIARMESRGRLAKQLRGLRFAGGGPATDPSATRSFDGLPAQLPARLSVQGKEAGDLTSVAISPRFGPIGLAYVRTAYSDPGAEVRVGEQTATIVELPFQ